MEACNTEGSKSHRSQLPQILVGTLAHQILIRPDKTVVSTNGGSGQTSGPGLAYLLKHGDRHLVDLVYVLVDDDNEPAPKCTCRPVSHEALWVFSLGSFNEPIV